MLIIAPAAPLAPRFLMILGSLPAEGDTRECIHGNVPLLGRNNDLGGADVAVWRRNAYFEAVIRRTTSCMRARYMF